MDLYKVLDILNNETIQKFPSEVSDLEFRTALKIATFCVDEQIIRNLDSERDFDGLEV